MPFEEEFVPIAPINFFQIHADCHFIKRDGKVSFPAIDKKNYRDYLLPDTSKLCSEESFAEVAIGWREDGIECFVKVDQPFQKAFYPEIERGDSIELFIDTRDVKTSGFNTRFCHHFFFLAEGVDGHFCGELTRFRTEDAHALCEAKDLKVKSSSQSNHYTLNIFIPAHCLNGYDPDQFKRLGFSYRINSANGFKQHYSAMSDEYAIEQQPSLWGTLKLVT